jgi:hypothetical protein
VAAGRVDQHRDAAEAVSNGGAPTPSVSVTAK